MGVVSGVVCGPDVLIEGLDDVVRFGERLPEAIGEDNLTIGEVAKNFAHRPLPRGRGFTGVAHRIEKLTESRGGGGDYWLGVAGAEKRSVGVHELILQFLVLSAVDGIDRRRYTSGSRVNGAGSYGVIDV